MLDKAKKALEAKEAEAKGKRWLSEVQGADGEWKDLEAWREVYEPKQEKKEPTDGQKKAVGKVVDVAFEKMQEGLGKAILQIMMEASSTLLETTSQVIEASGKDESNGNIPKILSATNALILSYRFETPKKTNKFGHIRKAACLDLTKTLHPMLPEGGATQVTDDIKTCLEEQKGTSKEEVLQKIDTLLVNMNDAIDDNGEKLEKAAKSAMTTTMGGGSVDAAEAKVTEATGMTVDELKSKKDDVVSQFGSFIKELLVSKMEDIHTMVTKIVETIIKAMQVAMKMNGKKLDVAKTKTPEEAQGDLLVAIDKEYKKVVKKINNEIKKVLNMIKALVQNAMIDMEDD